MSAYTSSYAIRYTIPSLQQQIEVSVIHNCQDIFNEASTTPDHTNRWNWASWANKNSSVAWIAFAWPVAMNPTIQTAVQTDPSGHSVQDSDVQYVTTSNLSTVVADFVAHPPPGA